MDMIDFAEKFIGIELLECQKQLLRELEKRGPEYNVRVIAGRFRHPYLYPTQTMLKELIQNGEKIDNPR